MSVTKGRFMANALTLILETATARTEIFQKGQNLFKKKSYKINLYRNIQSAVLKLCLLMHNPIAELNKV